MTVLSAVQAAAPAIAMATPSQIYAATSADMASMRTVIAEVVQQILDANEWPALLEFDTFTGDGVTETFTLPSDYDRMAKNSQIWATDMPQYPLRQSGSTDDWIAAKIQDIGDWYRQYLIRGNRISFFPVLGDAATVDYGYQSKNIVLSSGGVAKAEFTADDDTFVLPERLLTLGIIWLWKSRKGIDYSEEMATFQEALAREVTRAKGPGAIITSRPIGYRLPPYGYPR